MKRIEDLTVEQQGRMEGWADRWIAIGLRTGPADRTTFERAVRQCYAFAGIWSAPRVIWCPSPLVAVLAGSIAASIACSRKGEAVREAVGEAVNQAVRGAVGGAVHEKWFHYMGGQFWVSGFYWGPAYTSFFREVCRLELPNDLWARGRAYEETVQSACWWWPHEQFVMVSERPLTIKRELGNVSVTRGWGSHRLHCADGPAMIWPDGFAIWSWHGVRVTEQIVLRPETITRDEFAKETNAQVRQVMVERIGIERVCQMFQSQCLDKRGEYELLALDLGDGRIRPYLKMLNPSMPGIYHVEGVLPTIKTVQEALNWRVGLTPDQIDDIYGADWYEQGDVILKPKGAKTFKSSPTILT